MASVVGWLSVSSAHSDNQSVTTILVSEILITTFKRRHLAIEMIIANYTGQWNGHNYSTEAGRCWFLL